MTSLIKWLNLAAFLAMIAVNVLANLLPLGGQTTGQISDNYPNLFTPAPFTFLIWGVIYLFMAFYIIMQLIVSDSNLSLQRVRSEIGILFIASCVFNIVWLFTWHNSRIGLSVIFMLLLLCTLIAINASLTIIPSSSLFERITVYGFNLYLGWITVATIANISVFLVKINWSGFGISNVLWTLIVIAVGTIIGICFVMVGRRYFASLAVIWAFFGIFIKHISSTNVLRKPDIAIGSIVAIVLIVAFMIVSLILPNPQKNPNV